MVAAPDFRLYNLFQLWQLFKLFDSHFNIQLSTFRFTYRLSLTEWINIADRDTFLKLSNISTSSTHTIPTRNNTVYSLEHCAFRIRPIQIVNNNQVFYLTNFARISLTRNTEGRGGGICTTMSSVHNKISELHRFIYLFIYFLFYFNIYIIQHIYIPDRFSYPLGITPRKVELKLTHSLCTKRSLGL